MPYLCWIYNGDIQQGFIGIENCAVDMLIYQLIKVKSYLLLIIQITIVDVYLEYLQIVKPIVKRVIVYKLKQPSITLKLKRILISLLNVLIS